MDRQAARSRPAGWRSPLLLALGATAATWTLVTLGRLYFRQYGTSGAQGHWPTAYLLHGLVRWDAGWYAAIAERGYWYLPGQQSPVAFFPGYPLAVRALSHLLGVHPFLGGVVLSTACGLGALVLFHAWSRRVGGAAPRAWAATLLLVVYPYAFFLFGVMYSEPFFLVLVLAAFLCLEEDLPWAAALFGALATASRPVAPAVLAGLLVRHWERKRQRGERLVPADGVLLLAGTGLAAFVLYQWVAFGEPLGFVRTQSAEGWGHGGRAAWLKVGFFAALTGSAIPALKLQFVLHALLTAGALALAVPMRRHLGWGYSVYVVGVVLIPALANKDFWGMGRYVLAAFPCFLEASVLLEGRARLRLALGVASAALFCVLALAWGRGAWVA